MPDELLAATTALVTETVDRLQEVLHYSHGSAEWEWPRMLLYRITDAQDTLGLLVGLYAAHMYRAGCKSDLLGRYMQAYQQVSRSEMPRQEDFDYLAGFLGRPIEGEGSDWYIAGNVMRERLGRSDAHQEWTLACIHALQALNCGEPSELDHLPPNVRDKARRVLATMASEHDELQLAGRV